MQTNFRENKILQPCHWFHENNSVFPAMQCGKYSEWKNSWIHLIIMTAKKLMNCLFYAFFTSVRKRLPLLLFSPANQKWFQIWKAKKLPNANLQILINTQPSAILQVHSSQSRLRWSLQRGGSFQKVGGHLRSLASNWKISM